MDNLTTVTGMVVASYPSGEYDKRIILLTRELGRVSCFARGARKPTSKFIASTRSFVFGKFDLYAGRTAYSLNGAEIVKSFDELSKDFKASVYLSYFAEIALYYAQEGLDASEYIDLLYTSIVALLDWRLDREVIRAVYEIRSVVLSGEFNPESGVIKNVHENCIRAYRQATMAPLNKLFMFTLEEPGKTQFIEIANDIALKNIDVKIKSRDILNSITKN